MIRIGHNANTNMLPLFHFLPRDRADWELVPAEPAGHNVMLAGGQIDMAPISLFSYGEHWDGYRILSNLSVSVRGRVGSILLFSKFPLEQLNGKTIALTTNSATSVNLTKIILQGFYGLTPIYQPMSGGLNAMLAEAEAALLIGDQAIRAAAGRFTGSVYDLGEEWLHHTGLPMTYSVWAFPQELLAVQAEEVREVHQLLLASKARSLTRMNEIVAACLAMVGETPLFWQNYFSHFRYDLDQELLAGVEHYFDWCVRLGLLSERPRLNIWG